MITPAAKLSFVGAIVALLIGCELEDDDSVFASPPGAQGIAAAGDTAEGRCQCPDGDACKHVFWKAGTCEGITEEWVCTSTRCLVSDDEGGYEHVACSWVEYGLGDMGQQPEGGGAGPVEDPVESEEAYCDCPDADECGGRPGASGCQAHHEQAACEADTCVVDDPDADGQELEQIPCVWYAP